MKLSWLVHSLVILCGITTPCPAEEPRSPYEESQEIYLSGKYEPEELLASLDKQIASNPRNTALIHLKTRVLLKNNRPKEALEFIDSSIRALMSPKDGSKELLSPSLIKLRVYCHMEVGDFFEARKQLNVFWALFQDSSEQKAQYTELESKIQFQINMYNALNGAAYLQDQGIAFDGKTVAIPIDATTLEASRNDSDAKSFLPAGVEEEEDWAVVIVDFKTTGGRERAAVKLVKSVPVGWSPPQPVAPSGAVEKEREFVPMDGKTKKQSELPMAEFAPTTIKTDAGVSMFALHYLGDVKPTAQ